MKLVIIKYFLFFLISVACLIFLFKEIHPLFVNNGTNALESIQNQFSKKINSIRDNGSEQGRKRQYLNNPEPNKKADTSLFEEQKNAIVDIKAEPQEIKVQQGYFLKSNAYTNEIASEVWNRMGGIPEKCTESFNGIIAIIEINRARTKNLNFLKKYIDFSNKEIDLQETEHDIEVASIIHCLVPEAKIIQSSIFGFEIELAKSLLHLSLKKDVKVINISLGPTESDYFETMGQLTIKAIKEVALKGKVIVIAAGNTGIYLEESLYYNEVLNFIQSVNTDPLIPGKILLIGGTETVVGGEEASTELNYSNNPNVLYAPGILVPTLDSLGKKVYKSGTSFSAPIASASIYLISQYYQGDAVKALEIIKNTATKESSMGGGMINIKRASETAVFDWKISNSGVVY